ncbi:MAG: hypothetical protein KatS3mg105_5018 [Gemmatales bacterium]|nr:MAG: hypothetical protein KatS3mg105_5018 [Gemmatales bacterium]
MSDVIRRGLNWLLNKQKAHVNTRIIYQRGSAEIELDAIFGSYSTQQVDAEGRIYTVVSGLSFTIRQDDFKFDGVKSVPLYGDRIICDGERYEVVSPNPVVPPVVEGPYGLTWKVHVRRCDA